MGDSSGAIPLIPDMRIRLADGRWLGYAQYGDPGGRPLIYLHGCPGSRLEAALADGVAREMGVRLVAVDRPGYGLSDAAPDRPLARWPADLEPLADSLGLGRFALMGASGGGPFALACALALPGRVLRTGIVCGLGPLDAPGALRGTALPSRFPLSLPRRAPWLVGSYCRSLTWVIRRHAERAIARMARGLATQDRAALSRPEVVRALGASFREAVRSGPAGMACDLFLYNRPWDLALEEIAGEVLFFHGERDRIVPASMSRGLAQRIPGARLRLYPDEGHHSLPVNRAGEIFAALLDGTEVGGLPEAFRERRASP